MSSIYQDISKRTNGEIYLGVVGPVRTGKSTFVAKFMEQLILPNIADKNDRNRAVDELPQSADGKIIMTTQPKFVPNTAVQIATDEKTRAKVRLIDCVGYAVQGAEGLVDGDAPRLVNTPWSNQPLPFEKAAEIGTQKVVCEHSTVAVVVTNDGSITQIPRNNYIPAEERVIAELKQHGKPFVVVLNTKTPTNPDTVALANALEQKYGVVTVVMDVANATKSELEGVLQSILSEFPVKKICIDMPKWMRTLDSTHPIIQTVLEKAKDKCKSVCKMKDVANFINAFCEDEHFQCMAQSSINMGNGEVVCKLHQSQACSIKFCRKLQAPTLPTNTTLSTILDKMLLQRLNTTSLLALLIKLTKQATALYGQHSKAQPLQSQKLLSKVAITESNSRLQHQVCICSRWM